MFGKSPCKKKKKRQKRQNTSALVVLSPGSKWKSKNLCAKSAAQFGHDITSEEDDCVTTAAAVKVESHADLKISQCHRAASHNPTAARQNEALGCVQPPGAAAAAAATTTFSCRIFVNLLVSGDRKCMQTKNHKLQNKSGKKTTVLTIVVEEHELSRWTN